MGPLFAYIDETERFKRIRHTHHGHPQPDSGLSPRPRQLHTRIQSSMLARRWPNPPLAMSGFRRGADRIPKLGKTVWHSGRRSYLQRTQANRCPSYARRSPTERQKGPRIVASPLVPRITYTHGSCITYTADCPPIYYILPHTNTQVPHHPNARRP